MARIGILRRVGISFVAMACIAGTLGGCNKDKKAAEALRAENEDLNTKYATLDQSMRDKDARIAELEQRLSAAETARLAAVAQPQPVAQNDGSGGGNTGGGGSSGRDSTDSFRPDSDGTQRARLSGDVLFDPGQSALKTSSKKSLDRIASEIKRNYGGRDVRVEGHTDSDPIRKAKFASNQALSEARAESVRKYLISKGISSGRVDAVGFGSSKPRGNKASSRRVEIVIVN